LSCLALAAGDLEAAEVVLRGRVVDEKEAPVAGALIVARPVASVAGEASAESREAHSGLEGDFILTLPDEGDFLVSVEREGYYELKDHPIHVEGPQETTLVVNSVREVFQAIDVSGEPSPVDLAGMQKEERLSGTDVNAVPYPASHSLQNATRLMPGVVQDVTGSTHFDGGAENQVLYLLNGFNITDPVSGRFHTRLGIEGVQALEHWSGSYSPEYGQGSAGAFAITTDTGTDRFHYTATNFIPSVDFKQGPHLGNWTPRAGVSGPILRGRAWFADNFDGEYDEAIISGLPSGQNTTSGWVGSNLLHAQASLTASNILYADFLVNLEQQNRVGLGPLDPLSTTVTLRQRQYFASLKDQIFLAHGLVIELGFGHNQFFTRQTPQGSAVYVFSPEGRSGNNFLTATQASARDEGRVNVYLPVISAAGNHQLQAGVDADRPSYNGNFSRTGYEIIGLDGVILSSTSYQGSGLFHIPDAEQAAYLLDTWRITPRLQAMAGFREDWDRQAGSFARSPRVTVAWSPDAGGHTRISGGYSVTTDAANLAVFVPPLDQTAVTTHYLPDGTPGSQGVTTFARGAGPLALPRATNWSAGIDHQLGDRIYLSANYLRRRASDGFVYVNTLAPTAQPSELPLPAGVLDGAYQLTNQRLDSYEAFSISARRTFRGQYSWMASYTHSHALSNAVINIFNDEPLQVTPYLHPMPWDSPNRILAWAYAPLPWKNWAVAILADARTGFPYSVEDQTGLVIGNENAYRYPLNFDLNLHFERTFVFHRYRFAIRGGVNNLTDRANATAVSNVAGAPDFLHYYGNEGRHVVFRLRLFGRTAGK
jgi:hypothetical protein